jgi:transcriptional regulator with XRE-family HTH domain
VVEERQKQVQKRFGARLRAVRKAQKVTKGRKLSQEALALKCDLDRSYVGKV